MNRSFEKHDKVTFIKEYQSGTYRHAIKVREGSKGVIAESNGYKTRINLSNGKYIHIDNNMMYHYLTPALSLKDSLDEAISTGKQRIARELDGQSNDLEKLSKLVKRTWSAPSKRQVEQQVEKEIKRLMSLQTVLKGINWDE